MYTSKQWFFSFPSSSLFCIKNETGPPKLMFVLAFISLNFKQTQLSPEHCFGWWTGSLTPGLGRDH